MKISSSSRELVKALVAGDSARAAEHNDRIPDSERKSFHVFVSAFFSIMLEQQFKDDSSHEAIVAFVNEMRYDYRNAEPPIKPLLIEGLIRASCGEEHFFDEIAPEETYRAEMQVITKIAHQQPQVGERFDDFASDAELLAAQWESEVDA